MDNPKHAWGVLLAFVAVVGAGIWGLIHFSPESRALRTCEAELARKLKAPSTYKRIEYFYLGGDPPSIMLTYEAQNSFGVPIRSNGSCTLNASLDSAVWYEYSV